VFWVLKHPAPPQKKKLFAIFLVNQLCLFVQQNICWLRLLNSKTMQKFSGEGTPIPLGAYGASIFADMALKLNVTPPEKKS